jgi:hypothetical protein
MCKPKKLGGLAMNKRSGKLSLMASDAQNLSNHRPHAVGFPIRQTAVWSRHQSGRCQWRGLKRSKGTSPFSP